MLSELVAGSGRLQSLYLDALPCHDSSLPGMLLILASQLHILHPCGAAFRRSVQGPPAIPSTGSWEGWSVRNEARRLNGVEAIAKLASQELSRAKTLSSPGNEDAHSKTWSRR